ncbi:mediator of RNA polymerase II transcription subunit 9-like [Salminus brasiliensis]|uniref:mediator of RNA polymerase II transcription subunit 9-like n=1 Tax=Salminus brasiliensis TaxID=930266 RepID=UPI003B832F9C
MASCAAAEEPEEPEEPEDFSFLPLIHDIIKSLDKENQDVHQELNRLRVRIQEAREQISAMPGVDVSPATQQHRLRTLRDQVRTKNQLLHKYRGLCMFDIPKPS